MAKSFIYKLYQDTKGYEDLFTLQWVGGTPAIDDALAKLSYVDFEATYQAFCERLAECFVEEYPRATAIVSLKADYTGQSISIVAVNDEVETEEEILPEDAEQFIDKAVEEMLSSATDSNAGWVIFKDT
jgi:hypothetical protein